MGNNQSSDDERRPRKAKPNRAKEEWTYVEEKSYSRTRSGGFSAAPVVYHHKSGVVLKAGHILDDDEGDWEEEADGAIATACSPKHKTLKVFKPNEIKSENLVGVGGFGKVLKGFLQEQHVAIKVFHTPLNMEIAQAQIGLLMALNHRNLVKIKGIVSNSVDFKAIECPQIIHDYFQEGNLIKFLNNKGNPQDDANLGKLALDIVHGCEYLHNKRIIHGNLAARNIMVEKVVGKNKTHLNAKVADYGITAVANGCGENYLSLPSGKAVSVRWAPKELLIAGDCTFASDVWSFGVVLWEMWTKGATPFGAACTNINIMGFIKGGKSPLSILKPEGCPNHILEVMERIFKIEPIGRPTFSKLKDKLELFEQNAMTIKEKDSASGNTSVQAEAGCEAGNTKNPNRQASYPNKERAEAQLTQLNPQNKGHTPPNQTKANQGRSWGGTHNQPRRNPNRRPTRPPPYTPNPPPNHFAVGPGTPTPGPQMMFGLVPQPTHSFPSGNPGPSPKPNFDDEINRRHKEIKMLTAQKTIDEIQRKTAELTKMIASAANLNIGNSQSGYQYSLFGNCRHDG